MNKISVPEIVTKAKQNYLYGTTKLGDYVNFSMHDTVEKITAYINSKHTTGDKDSLGREKPYFNITSAASNIWYRATDLDRKDVVIKPDSVGNTFGAFMATVLLQEWMKKERFGVFLNLWGRALAQYGSAVVKFVEKDGKLKPSVIPWNRLIVDPVDFEALPTIEKIYMTPAQIRKVEHYDQEIVDKLCDNLSTRKTQQGSEIDNQGEFIELYEVHGELPDALLKEKPSDKDWTNYSQQIHVISFIQDSSTDYKDFCLYKGKEKKHPYMITHLIEEDGRTLSIGAVESLFDAQWMQNHTMKNMKDTLDLASKLVFQTSDANFLGRNVLSAIETGDILTHALNQPLTQVNNSKLDITALQNFSNQWKIMAQELTSTPDALRGTNPPATTPLGTTQIVTSQGLSLFEIMVENKGLALEDMLRIHIIPHLKTKMNNDKEILAVLEDHNIQKIDSMYIPNQAIRQSNKKNIEDILNGQIEGFTNPDVEANSIRQEFSKLGNARPFAPVVLKDGKEVRVTWKEALKDIEWDVEIQITSENKDKAAVLQTLSTTLQTIAGFAGRPMSPDERLVFRHLLEETGVVSPLELSLTGEASVATPTQNNMSTPSVKVPQTVQ